ncbi:MAG: phosphopantetheine-binding protein [Streptosporangiales bacterium]|nr:phosphopantetheine-binding protein [Streptosporangiales bacterium]
MKIVTEVVGEDFLLDEQITPETSFNEDLGLESIEFVELSEKLQEFYGERVSLVEFIAGKDLDGMMAITVGELVTYIESQLASV